MVRRGRRFRYTFKVSHQKCGRANEISFNLFSSYWIKIMAAPKQHLKQQRFGEGFRREEARGDIGLLSGSHQQITDRQAAHHAE
jgi:hypothetical protein